MTDERFAKLHQDGAGRVRIIPDFQVPVTQVSIMDWVQVGTTFGIPVLILFGLAWFGIKYVWPMVIQQVEYAQQERREFLAALKEVNSAISANTDAIKEMARSLERIRAVQNRERR